MRSNRRRTGNTKGGDAAPELVPERRGIELVDPLVQVAVRPHFVTGRRISATSSELPFGRPSQGRRTSRECPSGPGPPAANASSKHRVTRGSATARVRAPGEDRRCGTTPRRPRSGHWRAPAARWTRLDGLRVADDAGSTPAVRVMRISGRGPGPLGRDEVGNRVDRAQDFGAGLLVRDRTRRTTVRAPGPARARRWNRGQALAEEGMLSPISSGGIGSRRLRTSACFTSCLSSGGGGHSECR